MDPRTFDGMIRQLSRTRSRRSLVGGSLGASVLAAVGLGDDALARKVKADRCIPAGRRCGTKKNDRPCKTCCHRYHVVIPKGTKKCACRPDGVDCTNPSQCCTGICENGLCGAVSCKGVNASCDINTDCCSRMCGCAELFPVGSLCTCRSATCAQPDDPCSGDADCCTEFCSTSFGEEPPGVCVPP